MNEEGLNSGLILLDILRGYSKINYNKKTYYLKHFKVYDTLKLNEFELECFESAKNRGIKDEKELLEISIKNKVWSKREEDTIKSLKWVIEKSERASSKITDILTKKSFENSISGQRKELEELVNRKNSLTNHSAENLASKRRFYKEILNNLFEDSSMKKKVDKDSLFELIPFVNEKVSQFSNLDNILKVAYSSTFFEVYCLMYRSPEML